MTHDLDRVLWAWTVALAEQPSGFGATQLRVALDSTPLLGAGHTDVEPAGPCTAQGRGCGGSGTGLVNLDSTVTREVVVRLASEPEHQGVDLLAAELEKRPGLLQLNSDLGYIASPRMGQWEAPGVHIMECPWPQGGECFTKNDFCLDFVPAMVARPDGVTRPIAPERTVQFPASTL
jgi:hypothetical protein